jgi:hypothetical protein
VTEAEMISQLCARPLGTRQVSHAYPKRTRLTLCPKCLTNPKNSDGYCRACRKTYSEGRNR